MDRVNPVNIKRYTDTRQANAPDLVVVEEPLEIRVGYGLEGQRQQETITVTMRTPGDDEHLCLGFLYSEGAINTAEQVVSAKYCRNVTVEDGGNNVMRIELSPDMPFTPRNFQRNFYTNSSCGVCGKASIEHVKQLCAPIAMVPVEVPRQIITGFPAALAATQDVFKHTGGLHACGLFDSQGTMLLHKEDVGRHNALDKLIGNLLVTGALPASDKILMLSGRISFELVQKAIKAGVPVIAAVGAPSSLSVTLAKEYGVTLVGFLKDQSFNVYTGFERIID